MKKRFAPILSTIIVDFFILGYLLLLLKSTNFNNGITISNILLIAIASGLFILLFTMIYILFQRLKEIKEEEKDDLSKY